MKTKSAWPVFVRSLDHDKLERDLSGKAAQRSTFPHPALVLCAALASWAFAPALLASARANPVTADYVCRPALAKGERLTIDWNSGLKSITLRLPNEPSIRLPRAKARSGFRFAQGKFEVTGKDQR
jgi:hypothetical protein